MLGRRVRTVHFLWITLRILKRFSTKNGLPRVKKRNFARILLYVYIYVCI